MSNLRIILHIGQSKTGTTAIQHFLSSNRKRLLNVGVLYPAVSINSIPINLINHNPVAGSLVKHIVFPRLSPDDYFKQIFSEVKNTGAKNIILSAEDFWGGYPRAWDYPEEQDFYSEYRSKITALSRYLRDCEITILVYLRPQIDWLSSSIGQTIKWERLFGEDKIYQNDQQYFEAIKPTLLYSKLLDIWAEVLQPYKILAIPYERNLLYQRDSVADFLKRVDLNSLQSFVESKDLQSNLSLSYEFVEAKKIINRKYRSKSDERVIAACLEKLTVREGKGIPYRLSNELIHEVKAFVEQDNNQLNEDYINGDDKLDACSRNFKDTGVKPLTKEDIAIALATFEKEYARPHYKIIWIYYEIKRFMRNHARSLHSLFRYLKSLFKLPLIR